MFLLMFTAVELSRLHDVPCSRQYGIRLIPGCRGGKRSSTAQFLELASVGLCGGMAKTERDVNQTTRDAMVSVNPI